MANKTTNKTKEEVIEQPGDRLREAANSDTRTEQTAGGIAPLLDQLLDIEKRINELKSLYEQYDHLVTELATRGFTHTHYRDHHIRLIDNFADKNTTFKACFVKRYELKITESKKGGKK